MINDKPKPYKDLWEMLDKYGNPPPCPPYKKYPWNPSDIPQTVDSIKMGWMCPKCGMIHSPYTSSCMCNARIT